MAARRGGRFLARTSRIIDSTATWQQTKSSETFVSRANMWMRKTGLIHSAGAGLFSMSPLLYRSVVKVEEIIDRTLSGRGALRIRCGALGDKALWERSGRWQGLQADMFALKDRNGAEYCLQPTHEEAVTSMVAASSPLPAHQLPIWLYQITDKYRDEMNPRHGLLRARSFRMKDLYTFDADEFGARKTYSEVSDIYGHILKDIFGLPILRVSAASGAMGGTVSHEFHLASPAAGQDTIFYCHTCEDGMNAELLGSVHSENCDHCGQKYEQIKSYEIAHTFMLGTHYSEAFGALYQPESKEKGPAPLFTCCYGIGTTRLIAAALDLHSTESRMCWPSAKFVPYLISVIGPKKHSLEQHQGLGEFSLEMAQSLNNGVEGIEGEVLLDDRDNLTIGRRVVHAKQMGYPYILVVGKAAAKNVPQLELIKTGNDNKSDTTYWMTHGEVFDYFRSGCY